MHGPFVHRLNKGGLLEIVTHQRLMSTEARSNAGGAGKVRALTGTWEDIAKRNNWLMRPVQADLYIEFMTDDAPDSGLSPGLANWSIPEGQYLRIKVRRVLDGLGNVLQQPN